MRRVRQPLGPFFWWTLALLGPLGSLPLALWRLARYHVRSRTTLQWLAAPGYCAMVVAVAAWLTSYIDGVRWRRWSMLLHQLSPLHVVTRDLRLVVQHAVLLAPLPAALYLAYAWVLFTLANTIFLAPLFLYWTRTKRR